MIARALVAIALASSVAHADDGADPIVERAGDANLEPSKHEHPLVVSLSLGGSLTLGFGVGDAVGRGGAGSLRIAREMTPRWMLTLEGTSAASLHKIGMESKNYVNQATGLLIGAQYFVGPSFWLRGSTGLGVYLATAPNKRTLVGPAAVAGGGLDLARFRHVSIGLALYFLTAINREGAITASGLALGVSFF